MSYLISRNVAITALNEAQIEYDVNYRGLGEAKEIIDSLPTVNAIVIPDNATNGDMMKILFPDFEIRENKLSIAFWTLMSDGSYEYNSLPKEWWNTPYKKGENE